MGTQIAQPSRAQLWALAKAQHGVVTRAQLLALGFSPQGVKHRTSAGRLHPVWRGVYAVGRPQLTHHGIWMAAVLCCGQETVLSHGSAAALWKIGQESPAAIEVSIPARLTRRRPGIHVRRRSVLRPEDLTRRDGIPVTTPVCTLIDLAARLGRDDLEAAINEADKRSLTDPESLRAALDLITRRPGVAALRRTLDRRTFKLTDSELERRFLSLVRRAGLPLPETGRHLNGFKVDFYWESLGLVVETDGLRYHRTPAAQSRDHTRDQAHGVAGLMPLRFTHAQVRYRPDYVCATLARMARRLDEAARRRQTSAEPVRSS
jgi:very-short-patch-repair endonuclease